MKIVKIKLNQISKVEWSYFLGKVWIVLDNEEYECDIENVEGDFYRRNIGFSFVFKTARNEYKFVVTEA